MYLNDLRDLLSEANQEVPSWYDDLCKNGPKRGPQRAGKFAVDHRDEKTMASSTSTDVRKAAPTVQRQGDGFGMTGQEDAW